MNKGRTFYAFMWFIENYSYCWHPNGKCLVSPEFTAEDLEGTAWYLALYPRGRRAEDKGHISLYLARAAADEGPEEFSLKYEMSFLAADGSILKSINSEYTFKKTISRGWPQFQELNEILVSKKIEYLSRDTLSVCCKMGKIAGNEQPKTEIYTRTRIRVEDISFRFVIENFSALKPNEKKIGYFKYPSKNRFHLSSKLYLSTCSCCPEKIMVEIATSDVKRVLFKLKTCLLDVSGKEVDCGELDNRVDVTGKENRILPLSLIRQDIINKKAEYLPDDKLSLLCECSFGTGVEYKEIEKIVLYKSFVALSDSNYCINNFATNAADVVRLEDGIPKQSTEKLSVLKCLLVAVFACIFGVCVSYLIENFSTPFSIW